VKFLLDHDVPDEVARSLRYWGYEVKTLREVLPARTPDDAVFAHAQREGSIIVSCNRGDFLGLARQTLARGQSLAGLIILVRRRSRQAEGGHLLALIRRAGENGLKGNINIA
jgi:predicted nuclease of predicted toxin-antitoxin system